MQNNTVSEFLNKYRELEENIRKRYDLHDSSDDKPVFHLMNQREFKPFSAQIDLCRRARNLLSHNPKIRNDYPILPTRSLIDVLDDLNEKLKNPPRVSSIMISARLVFSASSQDKVLPILRVMNEKVYTHVPILEDGHVSGVFSENTLLTLLANKQIVMIDDDYSFKENEIRELLPINAHAAEEFIFISKDMTIFNLKEIFGKAVKEGRRIGLAFVTHTGRKDEKMLGIVSPWDIAGDI